MISDLWVIAAIVAIIAGLLASQALLIVVGALVLLIWITGKHWPRYAFRRLTYSRRWNAAAPSLATSSTTTSR